MEVERVGEGYLGFMFHISTHCAVTNYALERSGVLKRESFLTTSDAAGRD